MESQCDVKLLIGSLYLPAQGQDFSLDLHRRRGSFEAATSRVFATALLLNRA
jgi:hypothetical protein